MTSKVLFAAGPLAAVLLIAGCASKQPEPAPPPQPAAPPPPVMEPASPPPPTRMVAPAAAAGTYRLEARIESGNAPKPTNQRNAPPSNFTLTATPAATVAMGGPGSQFNATVALPGYSRAPRGRSAQAAAWWPAAGDSVVVQFTQGTAGLVQLRGVLRSTVVVGEIWYVSLGTGSTFQLGTFTANRNRR